jgi:CelD/BcsL family acetyltransferase involved in cellulose biosynthesis
MSETTPKTRVTVARTFDEVEALRDVWEALPGGVVTTDIDSFLTMLQASEHGATPHVTVVERQGIVQALAAGRLEDTELSAQVGYKTVYSPRVRAITISYGGLLGEVSASTAALLYERLQEALADDAADVVRFRNLRVGSPMHVVATTAPRFSSRQHVSTKTTHWARELPPSYDDFLASLSSRTREGVRRYSRKLEREYGERLTLRRFRKPEQLEQFLAVARTVAEKTYQHSLGAAITEGVALQTLIELAAARDWFRGWVLSIDDKPAAFWHGIAWRNVFSIGVPGYDPAYAHLRIGTYVLMKAIEDLCGDEAVDTLDFGFGDAEYKRRFGTHRWEEEDVLVYAPTFRGLRVNLTRTVVLKSAALARRAGERTPALQNLKRRWRSRLAS